jgi:N-acetylglutamate synthase-like GNAT family acetyltransferase
MEIRQVFYKDEYWDKLIDFVKNSSWRESPIIAKNWEENKFLDWERIFVAIENNNIAGHCSLNERDSVPDAKYTPYIQAVFVNEQFRGKRLSEKLILSAMSYAKTLGFEKVYIVSDHKNFYEKYGFIKIDEGNDYRGELQSIFVQKIQ